MKVDIKSFLIGVLTTVNLFLLMGFDDHKEEKDIGRYHVQLNQGNILIIDSTNGDIVRYRKLAGVNQEINKNPNRLIRKY